MDQEGNQSQDLPEGVDLPATCDGPEPTPAGRASRRRFLRYGACGLACLAGGGAAAYYAVKRGGSLMEAVTQAMTATEVFKNDAPKGRLWDQWQKQGWVREARHYLKLGANIQCKLCPNECLLEPEDRSRCRNRIHKDGKLYTLAYGNPCTFHPDPIEKKPLFHFLPGTDVVSIAISGCGFRCLNCQNWDISQRKPEETKDPRGEPVRMNPEDLGLTRPEQVYLLTVPPTHSMFPEDVVALAEFAGTPSIAYTYSEPSVWYEYMIDTARLARARKIRNVWVTCGYMQEEPLVELCQVLDAANVDLKSFSEEIYRTLNSGKLEPILNTLKTLDREGVWFEVTNLIVPTYTDKLDMIRRMCDWLVENLGPDYPLHFSRFHPQHKLTHLPPTPVDVLVGAQRVARECGLHYVYIGNVRGVEGAETTVCPNPNCRKTLVRRDLYFVDVVGVEDGRCSSCGAKIAGVWSA
jgi:pyruvate formate lyase activating enzyme